MRSQHREVSKEDKIAILRQEFDQIDVNHDDMLSPEELNNYLDQLVGKEFDRNVSMQLYERMDKNYDGKITRDEFIKTFLEAEEILLFKIENSKKYIDDYRLQRQNAVNRLDEIKRTEVLNSYLIMEDSVITITVIEGHNLGYGEIVPYCVLKCGRENYQTNTANGGNPSWGETFTFNIENGHENIELEVMDYSKSLIGKIILQVNAFKDQLKHDEWFDLERNQGGRLHLNVQWIHSKVKFLSDVVNKWDEHIKIQEEDLFDYEKDLDIIYEPFKGLQELLRGGSIRRPVERYEAPPMPEPIHRPKSPQLPREPEKPSEAYDFEAIQKLCIDKLANVICITILIFALFVCFNRAAFIDVLISCGFIAWHHFNKLDSKKLKYLALAYFLSMILDIAWLAVYNDNWWSAGTQETIIETEIAVLTASLSAQGNSTNSSETLVKLAELESELNNIYDVSLVKYLYRFVIVMSYFLLILKVVGSIVFYSESRKIEKNEPPMPQTNKSEIKNSNLGNNSRKF